jgi:cation diffusion facilitator CzcD-associated flavoprotein CzcO
VFISSQGSLNNWKWPNIPGLHDFNGKLLHTANWEETYDYKVIVVSPFANIQLKPDLQPQGKRIAVIGNGSSGIQVVPAMLPDVAHIDHYARSRTWLAPTFAREKIDERGGAGMDNSKSGCVLKSSMTDQAPVSFSAEEIARFKANPLLYQTFRKGHYSVDIA